jgi:zinc protease
VFYQAMRIGMMETIGLDYHLIDDYVDNIKKVTAKDLQAVARKYLLANNQTTTILDPQPMSSKPRRKASAGGRHARH